MRVRSVLATLLVGSTIAAAQPGVDLAPPPEAPPPPPEEPIAAPEPAPVAPPPGAWPPINITITNNNNGNNSNTNTQTNDQANPQTTTQTNTAPVTVSTPVTTTMAAPAPDGPSMQMRGGSPRAVMERYELVRPAPRSQKWLAVGVTAGGGRHHGPSGVRGSIDLIARGSFTLGVAASLEGEGGGRGGKGGGAHDGGRGSASAVGYIAYTRSIGPFDVRAQVGLGLSAGGSSGRGGSRDRDDETAARTVTGEGATDDDRDGEEHHKRFSPRAEASVLVGLPLGKRFGIVAGPVISKERSGDVEKTIFGGVRLRF